VSVGVKPYVPKVEWTSDPSGTQDQEPQAEKEKEEERSEEEVREEEHKRDVEVARRAWEAHLLRDDSKVRDQLDPR
jgi:hypothetical protein